MRRNNMPIKTNDAIVSVDFTYEDDLNGTSFHIKFHSVEPFGKALSVSGPVGSFSIGDEVFLSLPLSLISESLAFLQKANYLNNVIQDRSSAGVVVKSGNSVDPPTTGLSDTFITSPARKPVSPLPVPMINGTIPINIHQASGEKAEQLSPKEEDYDEALATARPIHSLSGVVQDEEAQEEVKEETDNERIEKKDEAEEMRLEREKASKRATKSAKTRKRVKKTKKKYIGKQLQEKAEQQSEEDYDKFEQV